MSTILEAIYEDGIFKPVSQVPANLREHEKVRIIIETEIDGDLKSEFAEWEAAGEEDFVKFEKSLEGKS
jgi:predicted DNA-binding antitoxin AbrB/MazE fold protein